MLLAVRAVAEVEESLREYVKRMRGELTHTERARRINFQLTVNQFKNIEEGHSVRPREKMLRILARP